MASAVPPPVALSSPADMVAYPPADSLISVRGAASSALRYGVIFALACSVSGFIASGSLPLQRRSHPGDGRSLQQSRRSSMRMMSSESGILKSKILQLAAVTDRGSMADAGKSDAYLTTKDDMRVLVDRLSTLQPVDKRLSAEMLNGSWELAYTTVQLFRASPFFQMVEANYNDTEKSNLFFKLHQLQTGSWGISSIGRITQVIDLVAEESPEEDAEIAEGAPASDDNSAQMEAVPPAEVPGPSGSLESVVDLILLPLTSLPVVGFWKLLPTFGGCVGTKAYCSLSGDYNEVVELTVQTTKLTGVKDVPLLPVVGQLFEGREFPTGDVTKLVAGKVPVTKQNIVFLDDNLRIMEDKAGGLFIYARPLLLD